MSYTVYPYLIDLDVLRRQYGSNNQALLKQLEQKHEDRIAHNRYRCRDLIAKGAPDLKQALREIIEGKAEDASAAGQYVYALEFLCEQFGELLPNELFQDTRGNWMEEVAITGPLLESGPPIPIAQSLGFPSVGHMTAEQAAAQLAQLSDAAIAHPQHIVQEGRYQYRLWLEEAVESGKGLVAFYY